MKTFLNKTYGNVDSNRNTNWIKIIQYSIVTKIETKITKNFVNHN